MLFSSQIIEIIDAKIIQLANVHAKVEHIITDSRKVSFFSNSLFISISGSHHDGHKYIKDLYAKGVRNFIIEKEIDTKSLHEANIFKVTHSLIALQKISAHHRANFGHIPVLAITGSNAKTIIKEWLSQLLAPEYNIVKNPKSYNSQIGVPLSVWQMNERHNFGIFEAGISKINEMQNLQKIIQPNFGIFTNIGSAHDEGFTNIKQKIIEKTKLFKECKKTVYCVDHQEINTYFESQNLPVFTWSKSNHKADINFSIEKILDDEVVCSVIENEKSQQINLPFNDLASIENIMHCIVFMRMLNYQYEEIQQKIKLLRPVSMRLELKQAINGSYLIDDSYNNDLAGLTMALEFLSNQNQKHKKSVILSDVLESGMDADVLYMVLNETLISKKITKLIGIGKNFCEHSHYFNTIENAIFYENTNDFLKSNSINDFNNEIILVKGARVFMFENIVKNLEQKSHRTVFEINLDALTHNLNYYRNKLENGTKIMVMVKSFAYGAGSLEVANLLQFHRVDYLCVAYADEGVTLRKSGISTPIMVLNISLEDFKSLVEYNLEPTIYSASILKEIDNYLCKTNTNLNIHLELETGMNRLGIDENEISKVVDLILATDTMSVASVFSHLAGADESQFEEYSRLQFAKLIQSCAFIEQKLKYKFIKHILNSAGIVRFPEMQLDMVRLGIGLYGIEANGNEQDQLQTVSTLKTTITQIKKVKKEESVGYSRKGKTNRETTIAIIAIGYGDGYSRSFSNGVGKVLINKKLCSVIGNVCMDMTMIDITEISAKEGDEVIIFGENLAIKEVSKSINTIPYELLTNVSQRVKRVFYTE